jgi:hypothetical protein
MFLLKFLRSEDTSAVRPIGCKLSGTKVKVLCAVWQKLSRVVRVGGRMAGVFLEGCWKVRVANAGRGYMMKIYDCKGVFRRTGPSK